MAIKKLQNNFTTPEQSKRLLELGIPADSADCYLNGNSIIMLNGKTFQENYNEDLDLARLHLIEYPHYLPCWSVGRLIEIFTTCAEYYTGDNSLVFNRESVSLGNINCLISVIELAVKDKCINFSKLEE